jgi:hypothetical protein
MCRLTDILAWAQAVIFAMVFEDEADEHSQLGGSCRTRTYNPLIKSQLLCQLS